MKINKIIIRHTQGGKSNQNEEFDFTKTNKITLGRSSDNDVQFDPDTDNGVSRQHAVITKGEGEGQFYIEDQQSLNGVFVNAEKISNKKELFAGDEIQLGLKGPKFTFDLNPRPQVVKATELMSVYDATREMEIEEAVEVGNTPQKESIGKETFERAIVQERKKSTFNVAAMMLGLVLIASALGYSFRDKLFGQKTIVENKETVIKDDFDAASIAEKNMNKLVLIETGWKLSHAQFGDDIYHEYTVIKDPQTKQDVSVPIFLEVSQGVIEPLLGLRRNISNGEPIASAGSGTGFVIDEKGHIMTNKHVSSAWKLAPYSFPQSAQQGVLLRIENGEWKNAGMINAPQNWIPGKTQLFGKEPISGTGITAEITYMDVTFAKTSQRTKATITRESSEHDLAILKIDLVGDLAPITFANNDTEVRMGDPIISLGFPGLSPDVVKRTKDQSDQTNSFKTIPNPTLADGRISKIINSTSDASLSNQDDIYSWQGETYQMTINTGNGNSGGPIFNKKGEVIAILNSMKVDYSNTKFTYAVPAKYALKLMGTQTVIK